MLKKRVIFKKKLTCGASLVALATIIGLQPAYAAPITPIMGNNNITDLDTWDTNNGNTGATNADITFTDGGHRSLTIADSNGIVADNANIGSLQVNNTTGSNNLTIGNGLNDISLTINSFVLDLV